MLPSSAIIFSFIFLEAARAISETEKNALTAISKTICNKLFNIKLSANVLEMESDTGRLKSVKERRAFALTDPCPR